LCGKIPVQGGHLDGSDGSLYPFVPEYSSGPVGGLLMCVGSEYPKDDRDIVFGGQAGEALGNSLADVSKVGGVALDDAAEGDHRIYIGVFQKTLSSGSEFKTPWHIAHSDVRRLCPMQQQGVHRSLFQGSGDVVVPFGDDNTKLHPPGRGNGVRLIEGEVACGHFRGGYL